MRSTTIVFASFLSILLLPSATLGGQERVMGQGPPPEIRALIDAFVEAVNSGSVEKWEAMAQARFTPEFLKRRPAAERAALYQRLRADFGTIRPDRVNRRGPSAPLQLQVRTTSGTPGVISLAIEESSPFRITDINVDIGMSGASERPAVPLPPINGSMTDEQLGVALDAYLSKMAADDVLSGVVLVAKNGKPVFEKAYGFADRANRVPNTAATRFSLGSINISFTALAIDQLVAQGKLAYSDTLGKYFPDYPQEMSRPATIEQLLNHTAGLADFFGDEFAKTPKDRFRSNADYFRFVSSRPALFAPGTRNQYCNGCYITLGAIIERVTGVPYEQYVAENIFTAAGMRNSAFLQADGIEPNVATGYTRRAGDAQLRNSVYMRGAAGSAAGSAYSTAADLLAYSNASRAGNLLKQRGGRQIGGIAGGAPGTSTVLEAEGVWTVVVLTNMDPPSGEQTGVAIMRALSR
jgi:CubicO group peptidase (beta-lactamase class C family)